MGFPNEVVSLSVYHPYDPDGIAVSGLYMDVSDAKVFYTEHAIDPSGTINVWNSLERTTAYTKTSNTSPSLHEVHINYGIGKFTFNPLETYVAAYADFTSLGTVPHASGFNLTNRTVEALQEFVLAASGIAQSHIANTSNPHGTTYYQVGASPSGHNHDERYYTESEVDDLIASVSGVAPNLSAYALKSDLIYVSGVATNHIADMNNPHETTWYQVGASASGHNHDERYYTESEIDANLLSYATKVHVSSVSGYFQSHVDNQSNPHNVTYAQVGASPSGHNHNELYYTESEVNQLIANVSGLIPTGYATRTDLLYVSGVLVDHINDMDNPHATDWYQTGASPSGHNHDERYYTESEVNALILGISGQIPDVSIYATSTQLNNVSGYYQLHVDDLDNPHGVTWYQAGASPSGHNHDERYYLQSTIDDMLSTDDIVHTRFNQSVSGVKTFHDNIMFKDKLKLSPSGYAVFGAADAPYAFTGLWLDQNAAFALEAPTPTASGNAFTHASGTFTGSNTYYYAIAVKSSSDDLSNYGFVSVDNAGQNAIRLYARTNVFPNDVYVFRGTTSGNYTHYMNLWGDGFDHFTVSDVNVYLAKIGFDITFDDYDTDWQAGFPSGVASAGTYKTVNINSSGIYFLGIPFGIGTTKPTTYLHIHDSFGFGGSLIRFTNTQEELDDSNLGGFIGKSLGGTFFLRNTEAGKLILGTNNDDSLIVYPTNAIAFCNLSSLKTQGAAEFHYRSMSSVNARFESSDETRHLGFTTGSEFNKIDSWGGSLRLAASGNINFRTNSTSNAFDFTVDNDRLMRIAGDGKIAVGSHIPEHLLHVSGQAVFTSRAPVVQASLPPVGVNGLGMEFTNSTVNVVNRTTSTWGDMLIGAKYFAITDGDTEDGIVQFIVSPDDNNIVCILPLYANNGVDISTKLQYGTTDRYYPTSLGAYYAPIAFKQNTVPDFSLINGIAIETPLASGTTLSLPHSLNTFTYVGAYNDKLNMPAVGYYNVNTNFVYDEGEYLQGFTKTDVFDPVGKGSKTEMSVLVAGNPTGVFRMDGIDERVSVNILPFHVSTHLAVNNDESATGDDNTTLVHIKRHDNGGDILRVTNDADDTMILVTPTVIETTAPIRIGANPNDLADLRMQVLSTPPGTVASGDIVNISGMMMSYSTDYTAFAQMSEVQVSADFPMPHAGVLTAFNGIFTRNNSNDLNQVQIQRYDMTNTLQQSYTYDVTGMTTYIMKNGITNLAFNEGDILRYTYPGVSGAVMSMNFFVRWKP